MSLITRHTETDGTVVDPWTQETHPRVIDTGWTCTCGAKSGRPKRRDGLHTQAAGHLSGKHGAPDHLRTVDGCPCGYEGTDVLGHTTHHERWVVEVWDA